MADDTVVIIAVYGQSHLKYLPSLLGSLWEHGHTEVIIVTDGVRYPEIDTLVTWAAFEKDLKISVASVADDARFVYAMTEKAPKIAKLAAWRHGIRLGGARKFVCLDVDSFLLEPLDRIFAEASVRPFNLALPRSLHSSGRYLYRPALLAGIGTSVIDRELESWLREAIMLNLVERRAVVDLYGSAIAAAFIKIESVAQEGGSSTIMAYLPGKTWNAEIPPFEGSSVVHFRGATVPPRDDDPTWSWISQQWRATRDRYFQRLGAAVETTTKTLIETKEA